jgi:hypothetical protein
MGGMRRTSALAMAAVLGLGLVACGGDDSGGDASSDTEATTTTEATGSDTDTTDLDLGDFSGECADFAQSFAGAAAAVGSAFTGAPGDDLSSVAEYFDAVADKVPEEIRDDFQVFADAYGEFAQALADADIDLSDPSKADPEAMAQLQALGEAFSAPEVQQASENIQAYVDSNCQG